MFLSPMAKQLSGRKPTSMKTRSMSHASLFTDTSDDISDTSDDQQLDISVASIRAEGPLTPGPNDGDVAPEPIGPQPVANPRQPRTAATGLLYALYSRKPRTKAYATGPIATSWDPSSIPNIHAHVKFVHAVPTNDYHHCVVIHGKYRFLVYSYHDINADPNEALRAIRPSLEWRGEIVIFALGTFVPFLSRATATRKVIDEVASRYISRVSEAYDKGKSPPTRITMNRRT